MTDNAEHPSATQVVCTPTKDPAVRWFIFAAMMIGFGVWCSFDRRDPPEAWDAIHINEVAAYLLNNWGPFLLAPIGLIAAAMGIRHLKRKLVADETGITYGRTKVAWDQITRLDASQLKEKGILTVCYGDQEKLKLGDWNLENFKQLVAFVESHCPKVATENPSD